MDRRIAVRLGTSVEVECFGPAMHLHAEVQDISLDGCRLEMKGRELKHCNIGQSVILDLNEMAKVAGAVVWIDGGTVGVKFAEQLDLNRYSILLWLDVKAGIPFEQLCDRQIAA